MSLPSPKEALLYLLLCALLAARHLSLYYGHTEFAHFGQIARSLALMEQGQLWFAGSELVQTGLRLGGPIYYWLHLPALLFHNPVVGLHLYYSLLELAAITLFLIWGPRLVPRHRNSDRSSPALASAGGVARPLRATGMRHPRSYPANASSQRSTHRNSCDGVLGAEAKNNVGLAREIVWTAALFLAAFGGAKLVICENMTIASYLAIALFAATARGLCSARPRSMFLPGLLLGATIQVHLSTLYLAPTLATALLLERRHRIKRFVWLLAGWATVVLISLPGIGRVDGGRVAATSTALLSGLDPGAMFERLAPLLGDPLALFGLILVLAAWAQKRTGAVERLASIWFAAGYLGLAAALSLAGLSDDGSRFATVNPARAILAAVSLVWAVRQSSRLVSNLTRRRPSYLSVLIISAVAGTLALGALTLQRKAKYEARQGSGSQVPCSCDVLLPSGDESLVNRVVTPLITQGLPVTGAGRLVVSGPAKTTLKPLLQWLSRSPRSGIRAGATPSGSANVMVSPRLKVFDLAILRGAHDYGRFFFLPGSIPLKYSASHGADEYLIQRDGLPQGSRLLMVTVSGPGGFSRPDAVSMTLGAERVPELDRCECFTAENLTGYASWLLFKLPPGPADLPLRLRLGPSKGRRSALWVVALPAEAR